MSSCSLKKNKTKKTVSNFLHILVFTVLKLSFTFPFPTKRRQFSSINSFLFFQQSKQRLTLLLEYFNPLTKSETHTCHYMAINNGFYDI